MVAAIGSIAFKTLVLYFAVVAVMASGISAHAGVSRLMYVMVVMGLSIKAVWSY